ncbi:DNA gyrase subunit A [Zhaonella formicivorans]|uniref:DNA gyrase subunit A n=1 Tax=Zhaonella formicivorans TaxID=2528593 RepID=UPI001D1187F9|nr:DNA gyrase subunit A [Zhaonella formicivorans]
MAEYVHGKILPVNIEEEMKKSYIDYAMSVIVGRALPDVRDGLKPVHRRILYAMYEMGMTADKPHKKSARVVGDVLAKYHPHGDTAVYDTMVRLAQDFSTRYPLIDGHGNFGSIDGDSAAAMRYTEARMSKIAAELLADIQKDTVDFIPNYDETLKEPVVLPSRFPNLLVNGSSGIAVGMATNIPPHNLGEVIDGLTKMIDEPEISVKELMLAIKGPDFPTGGIILGRTGIKSAYNTGRGVVKIRAKAQIERMNNGKERIVVTELPYQVNKAKLVEKIADLVRDKKIDGITDLRDESDRTGMRVVIELRRDVNAKVILNQLYKHTQMQETFGIIMLALVDGQPKVLNLKQVLEHYLNHQKEVVTRRTRYDLDRAEERAHIVEGLRIALKNLDEVVQTIRQSANREAAKIALMQKFTLSEKQADAILDMRLHRLTGLEREKLEEEYRELIKTIAYLSEVLANERMLMGIIKDELLKIKEKFADARRTQITAEEHSFEAEDLIAEEDAVITITHNGYIKRMPAAAYRSQKRGGRGVTAMTTRDEDFVEHLFITTTHHYLLFFTNRGKVYRLKVHEIPESGRQAKGTAIVNLLYLNNGEMITAVIPVKSFDEDGYLFMATKGGVVKKTPLNEFDTSRRDGIIALHLDEEDELIGVKLTDGKQEIILGTQNGMAIRFPEEEVRSMGRTARGVKGITLEDGDQVVGLAYAKQGADLLVVTENGFGKRTSLEEYRSQSRGGKGIYTIKISKRNGKLVALMVVEPGDDIMVISGEGVMIRVGVDDISRLGRMTQGVTIMRLAENDRVVAVARVTSREEEDIEE